jgi:alkanesulfonate monooxygenase SsuD/methylene tetrahydromethanopterin reductase-like flavin-dependent oxidoreductase (luciferase family)
MGAWLDDLSGGRLHLGLGIGGEFPAEFAAAGVDHAARAARSDEALEVVSALFAGAPVTFDGRWAHLDGLALQPPPSRPGGPPIWLGGRSEAAMRRAGRWARTWMPYMVTPEQLREGLAVVRAAAAAAGRDPEEVDGSMFCFLNVGPDGDKARAEAADVVGKIYRQDFSRRGRYLVTGTPEDCARRLRAYAAAGAGSVQVTLACAPSREEEMTGLLVREVLTAIRPSPRPPTPGGAG